MYWLGKRQELWNIKNFRNICYSLPNRFVVLKTLIILIETIRTKHEVYEMVIYGMHVSATSLT